LSGVKEVEEFNDWLKQQKVQPILIPETLVDAPIKRKVTEEDKFNTVYSSLCVAYLPQVTDKLYHINVVSSTPRHEQGSNSQL
jgi:hypothetical protein